MIRGGGLLPGPAWTLLKTAAYLAFGISCMSLFFKIEEARRRLGPHWIASDETTTFLGLSLRLPTWFGLGSLLLVCILRFESRPGVAPGAILDPEPAPDGPLFDRELDG